MIADLSKELIDTYQVEDLCDEYDEELVTILNSIAKLDY